MKKVVKRKIVNISSTIGNINGELSVVAKDLINNSFGAGRANLVEFFYYEDKNAKKSKAAIIDNGISFSQNEEGINSLTQIGKTKEEKKICKKYCPSSEHGFGFKSSTAAYGSADIVYSVRDSGIYKVTKLMEDAAEGEFTNLKELKNDCKKYCPDFKVNAKFRGTIILMTNFRELSETRGLSLYNEDASESKINVESFINYLSKTYVYKFAEGKVINLYMKTIHDNKTQFISLNSSNSFLPGESIFKQVLSDSYNDVFLRIEFDMRRFKVSEDDNKGPYASHLEERRLIYFNDTLLSCPDIKDKRYGIILKDGSNAEIRLFVRILEEVGINTLTNKDGLQPNSIEVRLLKNLETTFLSAKNGSDNSKGLWKGNEKLNTFLQKQFKENHTAKHKELSDRIVTSLSTKTGYNTETEKPICTINKAGQKLDLVINTDYHIKNFVFAELKSVTFNASTIVQVRSYLATLLIEEKYLDTYSSIECFIIVKSYTEYDRINFKLFAERYKDANVKLFLLTEEEFLNKFK